MLSRVVTSLTMTPHHKHRTSNKHILLDLFLCISLLQLIPPHLLRPKMGWRTSSPQQPFYLLHVLFSYFLSNTRDIAEGIQMRTLWGPIRALNSPLGTTKRAERTFEAMSYEPPPRMRCMCTYLSDSSAALEASSNFSEAIPSLSSDLSRSSSTNWQRLWSADTSASD